MIDNLKDTLSRIIIEIELGDTPAAMREIARFTVLFDQFLKENKDYIFLQEIQDLNDCMGQMLQYMELNNLAGMKKIITSSFMELLENWDFNSNKCVN